MAQHAELMLPCLDAAGVRSIAEVGAFAGDLTRVLVEWARGAGARVAAVDPSPQPGLVALAEEHPELDLIRETSLAALPALPELPDAVVIDGDHNFWTVREELRLIGERAPGAELPLLLFNDVVWPHGRRDDYFDAEQIPEDFRLPQAGSRGGLVPGEPGLTPGGLPYPRSAEREGGERNGVLTAVEDFVAGRDDLQLAVVPAFFGLGVLWSRNAPWAPRVADVVAPYDRNPLLERVERKRIDHLVSEFVALQRIDNMRSADYDMRYAAVSRLVPMHDSLAFTIGERVSKLKRNPDGPTLSRDVIRDVINDLAGEDVDVDQMRSG